MNIAAQTQTAATLAPAMAASLWSMTSARVSLPRPCAVAGHVPALPWFRFKFWVRVGLGLGLASRKGWEGGGPERSPRSKRFASINTGIR